jgi:hypothetical protein
VSSGGEKEFEQGFFLPPHSSSWTRGIWPWTVSTALEQRKRPCQLIECLRLLRTDTRSMLEHLVSAPGQSRSSTSLISPDELPPSVPCSMPLCDALAVVHPCSRSDGSHGLCGSCAVGSLRFELSQVRVYTC